MSAPTRARCPRPELMNFILEEQQLWKPVIAQIGLGKR